MQNAEITVFRHLSSPKQLSYIRVH